MGMKHILFFSSVILIIAGLLIVALRVFEHLLLNFIIGAIITIIGSVGFWWFGCKLLFAYIKNKKDS